MSDQMQTLKEDVSFLRAAAEDGGRPFIRDGAILAVTGILLGSAMLWSWTTEQGLLPSLPGKWQPILQACLYELWLISVIVIWYRYRGRVESTAARAISATWSSFLCHFVASWGVMLATVRIGHPPPLTDLMVVVIFALYAMAWWVAAAVRQRRSYRAIALGCYAAEFGIGLLIATPLHHLAVGAAFLGFFALPGFAIMREARQAS